MPSYTKRNRLFPTGEDLPGGFSLDNIDAEYEFVSKLTVTAETSVNTYKLYNLFFNNVIGVNLNDYGEVPYSNKSFYLDHVTDTSWYVDPLTFKPPQSYTQTFIFDIDADEVIPGSPIESVSPDNSWESGTTIDTSSDDVTITALKNCPELPGSDFVRWRPYWCSMYGYYADEAMMTIPQYMSELAVASYSVKRIILPKFNLGRFIEQLNKFKDLIDQVVDPAPEEWVRLKKLLGVDDGTYANNEDLLNAIRNTDLKDADALRVRLAEVESRKARLVAADKLIAESIARLDNKKGEQ